jgi:hypothetical protein
MLLLREKPLIFICSNIRAKQDIYKCVLDNIDNEMKRDLCEIISEDRLFGITSENQDINSIRFGCVTPETDNLLINTLLKNIVPIIFFGPDDRQLYDRVLIQRYKLDSNTVKRMIYNVNNLHEIKGAIRWVHTYYYHLRANEMKKLNRDKALKKLIASKEME